MYVYNMGLLHSSDHYCIRFLNFVMREKIMEHGNITTNTEVVEQSSQVPNQLSV